MPMMMPVPAEMPLHMQVTSSCTTEVMDAAAVASEPRWPMISECMEMLRPQAMELPSMGMTIFSQSLVMAAERHFRPCQSARMLPLRRDSAMHHTKPISSTATEEYAEPFAPSAGTPATP